MPRLTVVMPALNSERTIGSAIRSCLAAMPRDSELVVWDDGSADATASVADSIRDARLRVIRSRSSIGGGAARAEVIRRTDSEYVANMDADDFCFPWRFRAQERAVKSGADLVFGSTIKFSSSPARVIPSAVVRLSSSDARASLLIGSFLPHPTMYALRRTLADAGGYSGLRKAQDYELWLRCGRRGARIVRLGTPVLGYRMSSSQVSQAPGYIDEVKSDARIRESYTSFVHAAFPSLVAYLPSSAGVSDASEWDRAVARTISGLGRYSSRYLTSRLARSGTYLTYKEAV